MHTGAGPEIASAVMFAAASPGEARRVPTSDDVAGLTSLYGASPEGPPDAVVAPAPGGVALREVRGAVAEVLWVDADDGRRYAAALEGAFVSAAALPPGTYDLRIADAAGRARWFFGAYQGAPSEPPASPGCAGCGGSAALVVVIAGLWRERG